MNASEHHLGFRSLGSGGIGGVAMTILIHAALVAVVYYGQIKGEAPPAQERNMIVTQMAVLGKPREKFWLPRIVNPPRPKVQQPVIKLAENPEAPPAPKEAPKPEDAEISKDLKRALERAKMLVKTAAAEEEPEGSLQGSAKGTSSEATEGEAYATLIFEAIRRNWNVATLIDEANLGKLRATVKVRIGDDGTLLEPTITNSSGNDIFDDSCVQAIKTTGKVPPPPAAEAAKFKRGIGFQFIPTKGA